MSSAFPPEKVRAIVSEVAGLLKEKKETVSVAETVSVGFPRIEVIWVKDMWGHVLQSIRNYRITRSDGTGLSVGQRKEGNADRR